MKHLIYSLFIMLVSLLVACGTDQTKLKALEHEADQVHDEAMKDMAEMQRVKRKIQFLTRDSSMTAADKEKFAGVLQQIESADTDMSNWMANFKPSDGLKGDSAVVIMDRQLKDIIKNRDDIRNAITKGKAALPVQQ